MYYCGLYIGLTHYSEITWIPWRLTTRLYVYSLCRPISKKNQSPALLKGWEGGWWWPFSMLVVTFSLLGGFVIFLSAIVSIVRLCATFWTCFMWHQELWPTSASHPSLGLAWGKYKKEINIPILDLFFKILLINVAFLAFYNIQNGLLWGNPAVASQKAINAEKYPCHNVVMAMGQMDGLMALTTNTLLGMQRAEGEIGILETSVSRIVPNVSWCW